MLISILVDPICLSTSKPPSLPDHPLPLVAWIRDPYPAQLREEGSWHRVFPAFTALLSGTREEKERETLIKSFSLVSIAGEMVEGDGA